MFGPARYACLTAPGDRCDLVGWWWWWLWLPWLKLYPDDPGCKIRPFCLFLAYIGVFAWLSDEISNININRRYIGKFKDIHIAINIYKEILKDIDSDKGRNKKTGKKAVRLTTWVDPPPLKRSGKCKNSQQVVIFGVILPFYNGQNGLKFFTK